MDPLGPHSENIFGRKVFVIVLCFVELLVQSVDDEPNEGLYGFDESGARELVQFLSSERLSDSSRRYLLVSPFIDSR